MWITFFHFKFENVLNLMYLLSINLLLNQRYDQLSAKNPKFIIDKPSLASKIATGSSKRFEDFLDCKWAAQNNASKKLFLSRQFSQHKIRNYVWFCGWGRAPQIGVGVLHPFNFLLHLGKNLGKNNRVSTNFSTCKGKRAGHILVKFSEICLKQKGQICGPRVPNLAG